MKKLLLLLLFCFISLISKAAHVNGGEIYYNYIGNATNPFQYEVTVVLIADDLAFPPGSTTINYTSSCFSGGSTTAYLSRICLDSNFCTDSDFPSNYSLTRRIYKATIDLDGKCSDWTFTYSICCRANYFDNLVNVGSNALFLEAFLNNSIRENSSSRFTDERASRDFCINPPFPISWTQKLIEPDGDSIYFRFGYPVGSINPNDAYAPGYSHSSPIKSNPPVTINPANGTITLSPYNVEIDVVVIAVEEYSFDTASMSFYQIGKIYRDMPVQIFDSCKAELANWSLSADPDSLNTPLVANCGDRVISIYSPISFDAGSLSPNGTDFTLYAHNSLVPIIGASATIFSGMYRIDLELFQPVSFNGNLVLSSRVGTDQNTLVNDCGFTLPSGDSIAVVFQGCSTVGLVSSTGVDETEVFPNPVMDMLSIRLSEDLENVTLRLIDTRGQILYQHNNILTKDTYKLDMSEVTPGAYMLIITSDSGSKIFRVAKV